MSDTNKAIAEKFYRAMGAKDLAEVGKYIDANIEFVAPLAKHKGRQEYLQGVEGFMNLFEGLQIRSILSSDSQATVVYDVLLPDPIGKMPTVALLDIDNSKIKRAELFYDARPLSQ